MGKRRYDFQEVQQNTIRQLYSLENSIFKGNVNITDVVDIIPGAIMVHDFSKLNVTYMNDWGCDKLGHSMEEVNKMGDNYYKKHFKPEQSSIFMKGMMNLYNEKDHSNVYNFFHQVKLNNKWEWYFGVSKFYRSNNKLNENELIVIAHPLTGIENMVAKVIKKLDENEYVIKHYRKFALLTKREKQIIASLCNGNSSAQISETLFISEHTVKVHRKNIIKKLEISSFAELVKFAICFDMI